MTFIQIFWLVALAALWGASFLFMRLGAAEFGPLALIFLRVGIAAIFLLPLMLMQDHLSTIRKHWKPIVIVGVINNAIPFSLLAYASLYLGAGATSILNATAPMFTGIVGFFWLQQKLSRLAMIGLLVGFSGVFVLGFDPQSIHQGAGLLPMLAALLATFCYGWGINISKQHLTGIHPLPLATASLVTATIVLLPLAIMNWPATPPSTNAWIYVSVLAVACTAIAFLIYFHLINQVSAAKIITVTYLIPFFSIIWAAMFIGEALTLFMLFGGVLILFGVALSTGLFAQK